MKALLLIRRQILNESRLSLACIVLALLIQPVTPIHAGSTIPKRDIPKAPLPASVLHAKRAFLLNGQTTSQDLTRNGNVLAFDTFYADMKTWKKYELVDSPKAADIVIELQYRPYSEGSRSFGVYNPGSSTVQINNTNTAGADFALVIYDATSKEQLWSVSDACGFARLVKNQRKEVIKSIDRLVEELKNRTTT
jgi:hypothetical protein